MSIFFYSVHVLNKKVYLKKYICCLKLHFLKLKLIFKVQMLRSMTEGEPRQPAQRNKATLDASSRTWQTLNIKISNTPGYEAPAAGFKKHKTKAHLRAKPCRTSGIKLITNFLSNFEKSLTFNRQSGESRRPAAELHHAPSHRHYHPQSQYEACIIDETHLLGYISDNRGYAAIPADNTHASYHLHLCTLQPSVMLTWWCPRWIIHEQIPIRLHRRTRDPNSVSGRGGNLNQWC